MVKKSKKISKKRTKMIAIDVLIVLIMIISIGSLGAYKLYQTYYFKECKEFDFDNGTYVEHRISGTDEFTGTYFNIPSTSCAASTKKDEPYYENHGPYMEAKSCGEGKDKRTYIQTTYERCLFGCFNGSCMPKCKDPGKDDIFTKGTAYGVDISTMEISPLQATASNHSDYCTDENKNPVTLSKYLAKRVCNKDNFLTTESTECENICFDGACQKSDFRYCEDTDMNDQGKIIGLVSYYNSTSKASQTKIDSCDKNGKMVTEYFCGKDKLPHKLILTCRFSCVDGQCLQK